VNAKNAAGFAAPGNFLYRHEFIYVERIAIPAVSTVAFVMSGFHSGQLSISVKTRHTDWSGGLIATSWRETIGAFELISIV
jgi:hypothetical protein